MRPEVSGGEARRIRATGSMGEGGGRSGRPLGCGRVSSEGTAGGQQRRVRRRRTSTRLIVFAGSSWGRIFATFLVTVYLTRLLMDELGAVLAGLFYMLSLMTRFLVPLRAALSQVMTRE